MNSPLSAQKFEALLLHDAEVFSFLIDSSDQGEVSLQILFEWHEDEFEDACIQTGISTKRVKLTFRKCWRIVSNLLGYGVNRELIDRSEVWSSSEMITDSIRGFAENPDLQHYRITFSGGSCLDILATNVFLEEFHPRPEIAVSESN